MKFILDILLIISIAIFVTFGFAYAFQPLFPDSTDLNGLNTRSNFGNIVAYQKTIASGATSATFTDIACDANSCIVAVLNTNIAQYVKSVVPTENQAIVYLDGAAASDAQVSILVITK